jgi:hypothetical protein
MHRMISVSASCGRLALLGRDWLAKARRQARVAARGVAFVVAPTINAVIVAAIFLFVVSGIGGGGPR